MRTAQKDTIAQAMQTLTSVGCGTICRETRLVVLAARAFLYGGKDGGLQTALAQPVDWTAVEDKSNYHSITPVVALGPEAICAGDLVPE